MFHKVVWQHLHAAVGFLVNTFLQIYQCKKFANQLTFDGIVATSLWPHFFGPRCIWVAVGKNSTKCLILCYNLVWRRQTRATRCRMLIALYREI